MRLLFITIVLICILSGAEVDLFIPSFPELQRIFDLTPFMVQLTVSVNFIPYCICSLFMGALGDRYNRRTVMLVSLCIFVIGSVACVFAPNFPMLLIGRFLQGVGMAGPATLAFVIIADQYPMHKQPAMLGLLNGIVTLAMAFAPVVGSYVNLFFNWRGNFVVLLILGIISLVMGFIVIPHRASNPNISLSPKTYWPLIKSKKMMTFVSAICFMAVPYWVFIGMAPLLYMDDMGVPLTQFGFYQGAMALVFSIVSILSPKIMSWLGHKKCLTYSIILYFISTLLMFSITLSEIQNPMIITSIMIVYAVAVVFPINILYPASLEIIHDAKSRSAALINSVKLLLTAIMLEIVSYFYGGQFFSLGLSIFILSMLSLLFIKYIFQHGWTQISVDPIEPVKK